MVFDAPPGGREVLSKRTRNAKHYLLPDGRMRCLASPVPVHYRHGDEWRTCDPSFENLRTSKCDHLTEVHPQAIGLTYTSRNGEGSVRCELTAIDGKPVAELDLNIKPQEDGNRVTWEEVLPGLDIYLVSTVLGVEFFKVVKDAQAPRSFVWRYTFTGSPPIEIAEKTRGVDAGKRKGARPGTFAPREVRIKNEISRLPDEGAIEVLEQFTGEVMVIDKKTRRRSWGEGVAYPVTIDASISESIAAGADDVEEEAVNSAFSAGNTKIKMGYGSFSYVTGMGSYILQHWGGFRFQTLAIPTGSTINSATLTLKRAAHYGANQSWGLKVNIDNVDDAPAWSSGDKPSGISKFGNVALNLNTSMGSPGNTFTANVQAAMQQILNRSGWASGNDVRFAIEPDTAAGMTQSSWVQVWAFEKTTNIPALDVTYTPPGNSIDLSWHVQALATQATDLLWNAAAAVRKDLGLEWNVYVNINAPKTVSTSWNINAKARADLDALWQILAFEITQGAAYIHGPTRPVLKPGNAAIDLTPWGVTVKLGELTARVDAVEVLSLAAAKARGGKLYAVGEEAREKQPSIPAKGDEDAILFTLAIVDNEQ